MSLNDKSASEKPIKCSWCEGQAIMLYMDKAACHNHLSKLTDLYCYVVGRRNYKDIDIKKLLEGEKDESN